MPYDVQSMVLVYFNTLGGELPSPALLCMPTAFLCGIVVENIKMSLKNLEMHFLSRWLRFHAASYRVLLDPMYKRLIELLGMSRMISKIEFSNFRSKPSWP